ncbi:coiled-coil domain-containing protein 136-like isoform X1 [Tachysurus ichikawai]
MVLECCGLQNNFVHRTISLRSCFFCTEEGSDLKAGEDTMDDQTLEKEREKAEIEEGEKEKEEKEEKSKGEELEELRTQILHLLLELEEAQDTSQKHEENSTELQGETV